MLQNNFSRIPTEPEARKEWMKRYPYPQHRAPGEEFTDKERAFASALVASMAKEPCDATWRWQSEVTEVEPAPKGKWKCHGELGEGWATTAMLAEIFGVRLLRMRKLVAENRRWLEEYRYRVGWQYAYYVAAIRVLRDMGKEGAACRGHVRKEAWRRLKPPLPV